MHIVSRKEACLAVALLLTVTPLAHAQQPAAATASSQQPGAQVPAVAPAPAPPRPAWHGSLSAGIALASGVQAQRGYQLNVGVQRPFSDGGNFSATAAREYQRVTFPSESLLSDRISLGAGVEQHLSPHSVMMARSMFLKDRLLYVDSRYDELLGYGLHLFDAKKRFDFEFVPGVSFLKEDLGYSDATDWKAAGGFYEKFTGKINAAWSLENSLRFRRNFKSSDRSTESVAALNGMVTKTLGVQLEYQYNYESIVPPGYPNYLSVLSAGIKFRF